MCLPAAQCPQVFLYHREHVAVLLPGQLPQPLEQLVQLQVCHPAGEQVIGADIQPHGQLEQALSPHVFPAGFNAGEKLLGKPAALGSLLLGKAQLFSPLGYPLAHLLGKRAGFFHR